MSVLLENLGTLVSMIFQVIVQPNTGASAEYLTLLNFIFDIRSNPNSTVYVFRFILLLTFGIGLCGVSIGILRRFLWKN